VTADAAVPRLIERSWGGALSLALRLVLLLALILIVIQSALVVHAPAIAAYRATYGVQ